MLYDESMTSIVIISLYVNLTKMFSYCTSFSNCIFFLYSFK
jgi:hypothetical protein